MVETPLRTKLIVSEAVEQRTYQEKIAAQCVKTNTLVCLPTGLGKTVIAALVAAHRLEEYPGKKVVVLAPTKPLVVQHHRSFQRMLQIDPSKLTVITGETPPDEREESWKNQVMFCTPQVFMNDLIVEKISCSEISLMVFDEAHRAVGDYPYAYIAERYAHEGTGLVLGLTASPGSNRDAIEEVCGNLRVKHIETRTATSRDVKPFIRGITVDWKRVELPEVFQYTKRHFERLIRSELRTAKDEGILESANLDRVRVKDLLEALLKIRTRITADPDRRGKLQRIAIGMYASMHAIRCIELLETQGFSALQNYLNGLREKLAMRPTASLRLFLNDENVRLADHRIDQAVKDQVDHPKIQVLLETIAAQPRNQARRIMVFTNYRSTATRLAEVLNEAGVQATKLIGQLTKGQDKGLSQKKQAEVLNEFRSGKYRVLVATQIGEEGLDIAECDAVIFYDAVPSTIRYIQRRGRTGRGAYGHVTVLIAAGTRDEAYYWRARRKERLMSEALKEVKLEPEQDLQGQSRLERYATQENEKKPLKIIADTRETSSSVLQELARFDVTIETTQLAIGDYILSDRICVERKSIDDFAASIIDGRLFNQLPELKNSYEIPMMVVEGESLDSSRDIRPEAMMGAVVSVLVDYDVPIAWTRNPSETALLLFTIARREQAGGKREPRIRGEPKPPTLAEFQTYMVSGLPNIDSVLAKRLLKHFKSPEKIFQAGQEELQRVEGIGPKISEKIRRVLESNYEEES